MGPERAGVIRTGSEWEQGGIAVPVASARADDDTGAGVRCATVGAGAADEDRVGCFAAGRGAPKNGKGTAAAGVDRGAAARRHDVPPRLPQLARLSRQCGAHPRGVRGARVAIGLLGSGRCCARVPPGRQFGCGGYGAPPRILPAWRLRIHAAEGRAAGHRAWIRRLSVSHRRTGIRAVEHELLSPVQRWDRRTVDPKDDRRAANRHAATVRVDQLAGERARCIPDLHRSGDPDAVLNVVVFRAAQAGIQYDQTGSGDRCWNSARSFAALRSSENSSSNLTRAARAKDALSSGRDNMCSSASARRPGWSGSMSRPSRPDSISSGIPDTLVETMGTPLAAASRSTFGIPSRSPFAATLHGNAKTDAR